MSDNELKVARRNLNDYLKKKGAVDYDDAKELELRTKMNNARKTKNKRVSSNGTRKRSSSPKDKCAKIKEMSILHRNEFNRYEAVHGKPDKPLSGFNAAEHLRLKKQMNASRQMNIKCTNKKPIIEEEPVNANW